MSPVPFSLIPAVAPFLFLFGHFTWNLKNARGPATVKMEVSRLAPSTIILLSISIIFCPNSGRHTKNLQ